MQKEVHNIVVNYLKKHAEIYLADSDIDFDFF